MSLDLPRLTTADLDPATLDALFADLTGLTEIDEVLVKGDATSYAGQSGLAEARRALAAGARGIQIRYRWDGESWLDTLLRIPTGIRLVRTPLPKPPESP